MSVARVCASSPSNPQPPIIYNTPSCSATLTPQRGLNALAASAVTSSTSVTQVTPPSADDKISFFTWEALIKLCTPPNVHNFPSKENNAPAYRKGRASPSGNTFSQVFPSADVHKFSSPMDWNIPKPNIFPPFI